MQRICYDILLGGSPTVLSREDYIYLLSTWVQIESFTSHKLFFFLFKSKKPYPQRSYLGVILVDLSPGTEHLSWELNKQPCHILNIRRSKKAVLVLKEIKINWNSYYIIYPMLGTVKEKNDLVVTTWASTLEKYKPAPHPKVRNRQQEGNTNY